MSCRTASRRCWCSRRSRSRSRSSPRRRCPSSGSAPSRRRPPGGSCCPPRGAISSRRRGSARSRDSRSSSRSSGSTSWVTGSATPSTRASRSDAGGRPRRHLLEGARRAAAARDLEVPRVEGAQRGPMADAHDRGSREAGPEQSVQLRFGGLVERRGGFVEEEPLRPLHEGAGEGDALRLARREHLGPVPGLVEARDEVRKPARRERLPQRPVVHARRRHRVGHDLPERADRQVRDLRQEQHAPVLRAMDLSAPERPDAGDRARSEEHTSELQSLAYLVCRLLLEKKKKKRRLDIHLSEKTTEEYLLTHTGFIYILTYRATRN